MASTPLTDTRSPLTLLNNLPKEHEKAIKQAFYNTAANFFIIIAGAAGIAVYFILEAFLRPLLWAVLCGAFLSPFKRSLTNVLRTWLSGLRTSETPFVVGLVITPIKVVDSTADSVCNLLFQNIKLLIGIAVGAPAVYILWHFGPVRGILSFVQGLFFLLYDLIGYFSSFWIWSLAVAYVIALIFFWTPESRNYLRYLSIPVWLLLILHVAATAGILRVPLLILMGIVIIVGFVSEQNEILRQQQEGSDPNRRSVFETFLSMVSGDSPTADTQEETDQSGEGTEGSTVEVLGPAVQAKVPPEVPPKPVVSDQPKPDKPDTLNVDPDLVRRRPHPKSKLLLTPTPATPAPPAARSLSDQCFIALLWAIVLTWLWMKMWIVSLLLPVPLAIWCLKKLGGILCSPEGPFGDRVKVTRQALGGWIRDRKEVLMPRWLRGVGRLVMKGDQNIISMLESSLDKATSVLFILLLLVGSLMFSIFFAVQVQQESMYLVKTSSNLLNNSLHPEIASWLPNNDDLQSAMDSMVGNAYVYGRHWIASKVRDLVSGPAEPDNNTQIEQQVLEMWDRLYESWLARALPTAILSDALNATSSSLSNPGNMPFDITNLTSIWNVLSRGDGFNFSDIIAFVKENIGTFVSVLDSIWLVLRSNMSLVLSVLTSTMSMVFGGGTALLNFVISSIIFLTTLFYLLASSGDQYKPVEWFSSMSPPTGGSNTFGQAVQDAISGVFMASLKMAVFYGLYTWLTHSLFGVNIVFIPSALAAVFGAIPFVGTYLAAIPAVLELWLVQDRFVPAVLLLVIHFLPSYVVDTAIYSEIKGGHPYMTGLAIAGGMYWIGLEGAIFGPIILCFLVVLVNVYSTMMKPESPSSLLRSHSVL